jgi:beta-lactamase class A
MTTTEAARTLHTELALAQPLSIAVGDSRLTLRPKEIDYTIAIEEMLHTALNPPTRTHPTNDPPFLSTLPVSYNEKKLRGKLTAFARQTTLSPTLTIITETDTLSRSFAYLPGRAIDVEQAAQQVSTHLHAPRLSRHLTLTPTRILDTDPPRASLEQISEQVHLMAAEWDGVVGFYLYDMASDSTTALNENTVFSGASIMKVAILLNAFIALPEFTEKQQVWVQNMIVKSDNHSANHMLAAASSGTGTEDALAGAEQMNTMLQEDLGLAHTYQYMPYEASDYLINVRGMTIKRGPPQEGDSPYTDADPMLRTTPAEMSQVFLEIDRCSKGEGILLHTYTETLTIERCQEMLDLLAQNEDNARMRAGMPADIRVEHKSGWIQDMQADLGIVRSPGGDFLLAIYLYRQTDYLYDRTAHPVIAAFARMVYTAYNPVPLPVSAAIPDE